MKRETIDRIRNIQWKKLKERQISIRSYNFLLEIPFLFINKDELVFGFSIL